MYSMHSVRRCDLLIVIPEDSALIDIVLPLIWHRRIEDPGTRIHVHYSAWSSRQTIRSQELPALIFRNLKVDTSDRIALMRRLRWLIPALRVIAPPPLWDLPGSRNGIIRWCIRASNFLRWFLRHAMIYYAGGVRTLLEEAQPSQVIVGGDSEELALCLKPMRGIAPEVLLIEENPAGLTAVPVRPARPLRSPVRVLPFPDPGTDWLRFVKKVRPVPGDPKGRLRCLFLLWEFRGLSSGREDLEDRHVVLRSPLVIDPDSLSSVCAGVMMVMRRLGIVLTVLPHRRNNARTLRRDLAAVGLEFDRLSGDSIHAEMARTDLVVGLFSPQCLLAHSCGLPVVHLGCGLLAASPSRMRESIKVIPHRYDGTCAIGVDSIVASAINEIQMKRESESRKSVRG